MFLIDIGLKILVGFAILFAMFEIMSIWAEDKFTLLGNILASLLLILVGLITII